MLLEAADPHFWTFPSALDAVITPVSKYLLPNMKCIIVCPIDSIRVSENNGIRNVDAVRGPRWLTPSCKLHFPYHVPPSWDLMSQLPVLKSQGSVSGVRLPSPNWMGRKGLCKDHFMYSPETQDWKEHFPAGGRAVLGIQNPRCQNNFWILMFYLVRQYTKTLKEQLSTRTIPRQYMISYQKDIMGTLENMMPN